MVSARFRDIPRIIASLAQVVFLITPIIWTPDCSAAVYLADGNPFFHLIEICAPRCSAHAVGATWTRGAGDHAVNVLVTALFFSGFAPASLIGYDPMNADPDSKPIVSLDRVNVSFPVYQGGSRSLKKRVLFHGSAGRIGRDANHQVVIEALRDVSFSLTPGPARADRRQRRRQDHPAAAIAGIYEPVQGKS